MFLWLLRIFNFLSLFSFNFYYCCYFIHNKKTNTINPMHRDIHSLRVVKERKECGQTGRQAGRQSDKQTLDTTCFCCYTRTHTHTPLRMMIIFTLKQCPDFFSFFFPASYSTSFIIFSKAVNISHRWRGGPKKISVSIARTCYKDATTTICM